LRSSLGIRLVIPVLIGLVPFLVFTQQSLSNNHERAIEEAHRTLESVAVSTELGERLVLRAAEELLVALAEDPIVREGGTGCHDLMAQVVALESRYANLGAADASGNVYCSAVPQAFSTNISDRSYFQGALRQGETTIGVYQVGRITGMASLNVGRPLSSPDGESVGVVFAALDLVYLTAQITEVSLPPGAVLMALDANGTVLVYTGDGVVVGDRLDVGSLFSLRHEPGSIMGTLAGEPVVASSVDLNANGVLGVAVPERLVVVDVERQYRDGLIATFVAGLVGGGVAFGFAFWSVARPVERIRARVAHIAAGDLTARLEPANADGMLGSLSQDIDAMAASMSAYQDELRAQAYHDPLTGLANRVGLLRELDQMQAEGHSFLLIYSRIVEFRGIAATLGYSAGDEIVLEAARRLEAEGWPAIVARVSDTGFAVAALTADESSEDALWGMARIATLLGRRFTLGGVGLSVEIGTGAAVWPDHADDVDLLLRYAEAAARAPRREEVGTLYDPQYEGDSTANVVVLSELHQALDGDGLRVAFQPIVELERGATRRFEALLRWTTADGEVREPAQFIPVAERAGLVGELDRWVLRTAVRHLSGWRRTRPDTAISVNVSAPTLQDPRFPDFVERVLQEYLVPAEAITIEITETALVAYVGRARAACERFAGMGIHISVDDFGVGHSPVLYLREFPISSIKIDQSLVRDLTTSRSVRRIVEAFAGLGRDLGLDVVAEGVESETIRAATAAAGCNLAQGYLFSPALEVTAVEEWLVAEDAREAGQAT
jgi:diguanylate cyclase (GGDEF)-like protein